MPGDFKPIKGSEEEAKAVAKRLKTQAIIGQEATEKNIRQKLSQARLIHLATHGKFDDRNPLQGAIALAPSNEYDGLLTAEKILNLGYQINAELVVLSACDTGQGKISGDGVIGLSRSWMAAGVPSIIVSLWQVPDENATPLLMDKFYEKYHENNSDKAKALRKAMQTTKSQYPEPKNWTAFTLIGEAN
jgi:CHAT domain-containing protein